VSDGRRGKKRKKLDIIKKIQVKKENDTIKMCVREKNLKWRERDRQTEREKEWNNDRKKERERKRGCEKEKEKERARGREGDRKKESVLEIDKDGNEYVCMLFVCVYVCVWHCV